MGVSQRMGSSHAPASGDSVDDTVRVQTAPRSPIPEGSAASDPAPSDATSGKGPDAAQRLAGDLRSLRAAIQWFLAARRDQVKLVARQAIIWTVAIGLLVLMAATFAASACVILVLGIAGGVGELAGGRPWLGALITGGIFVLGGAGAGYLLLWKVRQRFRRKTLERYGRVER